MILHAIRVIGYGSLRGRSFESLRRFVAVYGPNEAGKSTLRAWIQDLLYGFHPAAREGHPYAPWDGGEMGGEAEIELASGARGVLRRRLLASPSGSWRSGDDSSKIANRPIDGLGAITRDVYESIYSLAREDLEFPDETWSVVRDRVIGGAGLEGVRPAREAADELDRAGKELWQSGERSKNVEARRIRERLRELVALRRAAEERERELRSEEEALGRLEEERAELERKRRAVVAELKLAERLLPRQKQIDKIRENEEAAGDLGAFAEIPADVGAFLREAEKNIASRAASVEKARREREAREEERKRFDARLRSALDAKAEIRDAANQLAALEGEEANLVARRKGEAAREGALVEKARALLSDPESALSLPKIPVTEAAARIRAYRNAREKRPLLEAAAGASGAGRLLPSRAAVAWAAALGVVLLALTFLAGEGLPRFLLAVGGAAALLASALVALLARGAGGGRASRAPDREANERALRGAREEEGAALSALRRALRDVHLLDSRLEEPDETLAGELLDLQRTIEECRTGRGEIASAEERNRERKAKISSAARLLGVEAAGEAESVRRMEQLLEEAREAERLHESAGRRLRDLGTEIVDLEAEERRALEEKSAFERKLLSLGAGDVAACSLLLEERREAARRARAARLEIESAGESFDALAEEIRLLSERGELRSLTEEEIVRLDQASEEMTEALRVNEGERATERKTIEHLRDEAGVAEIEGERMALREELHEAETRRDRFALLAGIVREADARYRKEHEPDILGRAAEWFSFVSGGRYDRLELGAGAGSLDLRPPEAEGPVPAAFPISRGTLDQIYLCLRLALVDHLEAGGESLPLLFDDVLLHWDQERRERGLEILKRVAERRQVFLFTCRPEIALSAEKAGAGLVDLAPIGAGGGGGGAPMDAEAGRVVP